MPEKRLTREIAEQFLVDDDSADLSEFTELDDDAAESLSKYEGTILYLEGLTSLSAAERPETQPDAEAADRRSSCSH